MPPREWWLRVQDILEAIESIRQYTAGLTFEAFSADRRTVAAVAYNFTVIGEAARHVPAAVQRRHPHIPWASMRAMRNVVVHQYAELDHVVLWDTCQNDLPPLVPLLRAVLPDEQP
jgi:uncharacterized protein with HEPN domain